MSKFKESRYEMEISLEQILEAYRRIATVSYYQVFIAFVLIDVVSGFFKAFINKDTYCAVNETCHPLTGFKALDPYNLWSDFLSIQHIVFFRIILKISKFYHRNSYFYYIIFL